MILPDDETNHFITNSRFLQKQWYELNIQFLLDLLFVINCFIFVFYIRFLCLSPFSCLFVEHRLFVKIKIQHRDWNIPAAGNGLINLFLVLYSWYNRVKFSVCLLIWKRNMSMQGCEMLMSQFWYRYLLNDCVETYVSKISNLINTKYREYYTRILFIILIYIVYTVYRTLAEILCLAEVLCFKYFRHFSILFICAPLNFPVKA